MGTKLAPICNGLNTVRVVLSVQMKLRPAESKPANTIRSVRVQTSRQITVGGRGGIIYIHLIDKTSIQKKKEKEKLSQTRLPFREVFISLRWYVCM